MEGGSAARAHLRPMERISRASARASLLSLTPPTGMPALPDPPQHTQRRDLTLTSTCRRSWTARPARDVGCSCTSISRLCSPRHAGGCHERYEGTTSAGNDGWGSSCASRAAKATRSDFSGHSALIYLDVAWATPEANQALLPVLAARATTANTDGHHAAAPSGRDTGTQEERAAIASL